MLYHNEFLHNSQQNTRNERLMNFNLIKIEN